MEISYTVEITAENNNQFEQFRARAVTIDGIVLEEAVGWGVLGARNNLTSAMYAYQRKVASNYYEKEQKARTIDYRRL